MKDKAQVSSYRWVVLFHLYDCRVHFAATLVEFRSNNNTHNDINFQNDKTRSRPSIDGLAINFIPVSIPAGLLIDKKGFKFGVYSNQGQHSVNPSFSTPYQNLQLVVSF